MDVDACMYLQNFIQFITCTTYKHKSYSLSISCVAGMLWPLKQICKGSSIPSNRNSPVNLLCVVLTNLTSTCICDFSYGDIKIKTM